MDQASNYDIWEWKCINAAVIHRQGSSSSPSKNKKGKANHRRERGNAALHRIYRMYDVYIYINTNEYLLADFLKKRG